MGKVRTDRCGELTIGVWYKSQAADEKEVDKMFRAINGASKGRVSLIGDLNFPGINCDTLYSDWAGSECKDLILDNSFVQHKMVLTRENHVLDFVRTSDINMVENQRIL